MASYTSWVLSFSLFVFVYALKARREKSKLPRPPGPKALPVIGNALDIPREKGWLTYTEWGKRYGSSLVYANALGQHLLIINRFEDAEELLEERAQITSDRPYLPLLTLMGVDAHTALMKYGNPWRKHRKLIHQSLRKSVLGRYEATVNRKVAEYLHDLVKDPGSFLQHAKIYNSSIVTNIFYGYDIVSDKDEFYQKAESGVNRASHALLPGMFLVNTLPFLRHLPRWFPGAGFHDHAAETKKQFLEIRDMPFDYAKSGLVDGPGRESLVGKWLQETKKMDERKEEMLRDVAASVFEAGIDTTSSALSSWFLAMLLHPEAQKKAQDEIAEVVGTDRLPNFRDRPSLTYLEAMYRETLRWRPPLPLGIPHRLVGDDIYKGYFIPAGTLMLPNIWAMTRNEEVYPDPEAFRPERFLNPDGSLNDDDRTLAFGFGRRICPGKYLASDAFWLAMAQTLATFDLSRAKDESGKLIELTMEYTDEGVSRPEPFPCVFSLRRELEDSPANS